MRLESHIVDPHCYLSAGQVTVHSNCDVAVRIDVLTADHEDAEPVVATPKTLDNEARREIEYKLAQMRLDNSPQASSETRALLRDLERLDQPWRCDHYQCSEARWAAEKCIEESAQQTAMVRTFLQSWRRGPLLARLAWLSVGLTPFVTALAMGAL